MEVSVAEISEIIKQQIKGYEKQIELRETGTVIYSGDGIARIYGLENAAAGERLGFPPRSHGGGAARARAPAGVVVAWRVWGGWETARARRPVGRGPTPAAESRRIEVKAPG